MGSNDQLPSAATSAVPMTLPLSRTCTRVTSVGSTLPLYSGLLSSVVSPETILPCTGPTSSQRSNSFSASIDGAMVSYACVASAALLGFLAASWAAPSATSTEISPSEPAGGVTTKVYTEPLTAVNSPTVPPVTLILLASNPTTSSLNVKVNVTDPSTPTISDTSSVIVSTGGAASTTASVGSLELPAGSVAVTVSLSPSSRPGFSITALPSASASTDCSLPSGNFTVTFEPGSACTTISSCALTGSTTGLSGASASTMAVIGSLSTPSGLVTTIWISSPCERPGLGME